MKKITIEFDETDSYSMVLSKSKEAIQGSMKHLNIDENIRVKLDKGLKSGCITQRGRCIPFMEVIKL